jgi:hypothetical protein
MNWVVAKIKWIMLVAGALTCSMLYAAVMPSEAVDFLFDRTLDSALAKVIVPCWAALVGLVGAMLIYGAFVPQVRTLVLSVAGSSKLVFLGLMLARGRQYLDERVGLVIALDVVMVAFFVLFMIGVRRTGAGREDVGPQSVSLAPRADQGVRLPPRPPLVKSP